MTLSTASAEPIRDAAPAAPLDALLRRFFREWLWPRRLEIVGVLILTALLAAATGTYPIVIKYSFDSLLAGETSLLPLILGAVVCVTAIRSVLLFTQTIASNRLIVRLGTELRKAVFSKLMTLDFARVTRDAPGQHVSRLTNEIRFVEQAVQATLNSAIRDSLSMVVLIGTMIYLDWVMSAVVLLVYPVAFWPIVAVSRHLRRVAKQTQAQLGDMTSLLTEQFASTRLIKAFQLEDYARGRTNDSFEQHFHLKMRAVRNRAKIDPLLEALGGVAVAGVIGLAYLRISSGESTVGDFMGFVSALLMAAQPIRGLGNLTARVQEGIAAGERLYALMDEEPGIVDKPGAPALALSSGRITFERATFHYPGAREDGVGGAVENVSLTVAGGTTVAIVGRSGAGKSTLVNLVPRLFEVSSGRILIDAQDIRDVSLESLRSQIAIVSQDVSLFDDTIRANIALGRLDADDDAVIAAAKAAAAHDFIMMQPDGYDTRTGDAGIRLSGGQKQRIALARAILKDAKILLLDEATSALDAESERAVQTALHAFSKDRTTLVIAHRLSTVRNADTICVMDEGRIVERGTHEALLEAGGIYADLCRTQLRDGNDAGDASDDGGAEADGGIAEPRAEHTWPDDEPTPDIVTDAKPNRVA